MLKIPRYNVGAIDNEVIRWDQAESGEWCKWEDVQAALKQQEAKHNEELGAKIALALAIERDRATFQGRVAPIDYLDRE